MESIMKKIATLVALMVWLVLPGRVTNGAMALEGPDADKVDRPEVLVDMVAEAVRSGRRYQFHSAAAVAGHVSRLMGMVLQEVTRRDYHLRQAVVFGGDRLHLGMANCHGVEQMPAA
jgi:hypothetical protein